MTFLHILTGSLALFFGLIAIFAPKGKKLHRKAGTGFVFAMMSMLLIGALMALMLAKMLSVLAALLSLYLVATAYLTVKTWPVSPQINSVMPIFALFIGLGGLATGIMSLTLSNGLIDGQPALVAIIFGAIAVVGCIFDVLAMRNHLNPKDRIRRHIWRMCCALLISLTSLFLGQADNLSQWINAISTGLALILIVLLLMVFYMVKPLHTVTVCSRSNDAYGSQWR